MVSRFGTRTGGLGVPDGDDLEERLSDLDPPWYLSIVLDENLDLTISTNLNSDTDVLRVLAEAISHITGGPDWAPGI
jgi:hypothetical protein